MKSFKIYFLLVTIALSAIVANAGTKTWCGPLGGSWHEPLNWLGGEVPTENDTVFILEGDSIDVGGLGFECADLANQGIIFNAGNINVGVRFVNQGVIRGAKNINVEGQFFNDGLLDGCMNLYVKNNAENNGTIKNEDPDSSAWHMNLNAKGEFHNHGEMSAKGTVNIIVDFLLNHSTGLIEGENIKLMSSGGGVENEGEIRTLLFASLSPDGHSIIIWCWGGDRDTQVVVLANINLIKAADNHSDEDGGDNVYIFADKIDNTGIIQTGANGTAPDLYGGFGFLKAKEFSAYIGSQLTTGAGGSLLIMGKKVNFFPRMLKSPLEDEPIVNTELLMLAGAELRFSYLHENSIVGENGIEIENINSPGHYANFFSLEEPAVFNCLYGDIYIKSDNIIPPSIGMNAICDPDPIISETLPTYTYMSIFAPTAMSKRGVVDSVFYVLRNEQNYARTYDYTITSMLGWFAPITGTTDMIEPWEKGSIKVLYTTPPAITDAVVDSVTIEVAISSWMEYEYTTIVAMPFDTFTPLSVDEPKQNIPEQLEISTNPNPFNSSCEITAPANSEIEIFDINGRCIADLLPSTSPSTGHSRSGSISPSLTKEGFGVVSWSPSPGTPSGIYLVRASFGGQGDLAPTGQTVLKRVMYLK